MAAAVRDVFRSSHQLCIYHLGLTFAVSLAAALGGVGSGSCRTAATIFWKIARQTDVNTLNDFDFEWENLTDFVESMATETNEKAMSTARDWLEKTGARKKRWAYRYTWGTFSAGQNTSGVSCARAQTALSFRCQAYYLHQLSCFSRSALPASFLFPSPLPLSS